MRRFFIGIVLFSIAVAFFACSDKNDSLEKMRENELAKLDVFINEHYPDSIAKPSGLYFVENIEGTGDSLIRFGDLVYIYYATWTIDSSLVDQSEGYLDGHNFDPLDIRVGEGSVIKGLEEALLFMREGGKANLVIPSEIAYGQNGKSPIPGFTTLLMEVEIYKVYPINPPTEEE